MSAQAATPHVQCVGSMMIDLMFYLGRAPDEGETVFGEDFAQGFGGKGANQAVVAKLLGAEVSMVGALGDDAFADQTMENFRELGIDASGVVRLAESYSGVAGIMVEPGGGNRIVLGAGANQLLTAEHVERAMATLPPAHVVLSQLEVPQESITRAFTLAREAGAVTVLTPAPAAPLDDTLLAVTDWVVPNHHELAVLGGFEVGEDPAAWVRAAEEFAAETSTSVVLTMGEHGAALVRSGEETAVVPARQVTAVDTTGAGDALCGSFAWALADGRDPVAALELATRYAGDSVTRKGTQKSYARGEALAAVLQR